MASFFCLELPNFVFWNAFAPEAAFAAHKIWASARERKIGKAPFGALRKSERSRARFFTFRKISKKNHFPVDTQE